MQAPTPLPPPQTYTNGICSWKWDLEKWDLPFLEVAFKLQFLANLFSTSTSSTIDINFAACLHAATTIFRQTLSHAPENLIFRWNDMQFVFASLSRSLSGSMQCIASLVEPILHSNLQRISLTQSRVFFYQFWYHQQAPLPLYHPPNARKFFAYTLSLLIGA